jgi:hypothetical protein
VTKGEECTRTSSIRCPFAGDPVDLRGSPPCCRFLLLGGVRMRAQPASLSPWPSPWLVVVIVAAGYHLEEMKGLGE